MFSYGSSSSISLATVTPSCVIVGAPNFLSSATLRPFGPRVVATALARVSTPRCSLRRASSLKMSCLAAMVVSPCKVWIQASGLRLQASARVIPVTRSDA